MSDFLLLFFIVLLALVPPALIVLGILLRKEYYGVVLFMIGSCCISFLLIQPIVELLSSIICKILYVIGIDAEFRNTSILIVPLFIAAMYGSYKLFQLILFWKSRKYIAIAKQFISQMQSAAYPSCEEIIVNSIKDKILNSKSNSTPNDIQKSTEIMVYNTALELLSSKKYHTVCTGGLTSLGENLRYLCTNCLSLFLKKKYISSEQFDSENEFLQECRYHDFFNGPQPYEERKSIHPEHIRSITKENNLLRLQPCKTNASSNTNDNDPIYLVESKNGMLIRVPQSKYDSWKKAQSSKESPQLTEEEQLLKQMILDDIYGK